MKHLNIHYLQHAQHEGLGMMEDWFLDRGHRLSRTALYRTEHAFPDLHDVDWLVVMGGPMGVYEEEAYPWLASEKNWIRNVIQAGKPVLGICLGAQLIASALGNRVYPNTEKEIGWFPVTFSTQAKKIPWLVGVADTVPVFHWHGDTFDLPEDSVSLASSKLTAHQGFQIGDRIVGLQFHLETDRKALEAFLEADMDELTGTGSVQTVEEARRGCIHAKASFDILDQLLLSLEAVIK